MISSGGEWGEERVDGVRGCRAKRAHTHTRLIVVSLRVPRRNCFPFFFFFFRRAISIQVCYLEIIFGNGYFSKY